MTIAAAHLAMFGKAEANDRAPRELSALGGAIEWIERSRSNSSMLASRRSRSADTSPKRFPQPISLHDAGFRVSAAEPRDPLGE